MRNQAPVFGWSGLAGLLMGLSALLLGGCAQDMTRPPPPPDPLAFLTQAIEADDHAREAMWKAASGAGPSDDAVLRTALLQSLPGHSGYDLAAAHDTLSRLARKEPEAPRVAAVAHLRLAQIDEHAGCTTEVIQLRQRLARVVEIEKRLNSKGH